VDFCTYFKPVHQHTLTDCPADIRAGIAYVDEIFSGDNTTTID